MIFKVALLSGAEGQVKPQGTAIPHRLCPPQGVVVSMIFGAMQEELLIPDRPKGREQTKRDPGCMLSARDGEVRFPYTSAHKK